MRRSGIMTKRHNPFHLMMPSIYLQHGLTSKSQVKSKPNSNRIFNATRYCNAVTAVIAFIAASVTIFICLRHSYSDDKLFNSKKVITYMNPHPRNLLLQNQVFISVKTTFKNHQKRLQPVISTWYQLARDHTYFFTDQSDRQIETQLSPGHLVVTQCGSSHSRQDLCCKMGSEFDAFLESRKKWFCHFDDDNYVNVPALVQKLSQFDHKQDWYLGKPSLPEPLEILDRDHNNHQQSVKFWFATGGAGFCLSQSLASKLMPLIGGGKFESVGDKIRLPDDVTMGYAIEHLLGVPLTTISEFHSHMEPHRWITDDTLAQGISFSYSSKQDQPDQSNVLTIERGFSTEEDPTRFRSLHCQLFPNFSWCP